MARRALFLISMTAIVFIIACRQETGNAIPPVSVAAGNPGFRTQEGRLLLDGANFSGHIYQLYPKGDTALVASYLNGREEGWCRQWYENGTVKETRFYHRGKKEGRHQGYFENGRLKFEYNFLDGEHQGEAKEFFPDGSPFRLFHYNQGHEEGRQQMWWEDGTVRANYVVRNGEQFGLTGKKLCRNLGYAN